MKKLLFGFLLVVFFIPFAFPLWAEPIASPVTVEAGEDNLVHFFDDQGSIGSMYPVVFTEGWQPHDFTASSNDSRFTHMAFLKGGGSIGLQYKLKTVKSKLYVHMAMTALEPVSLIAARVTVELPYSDWEKSPYQLGKIQGEIPEEKSSKIVIAKDNSGNYFLGPATGGLTLRTTSSELSCLLQDSRQWGNLLSIIFTHGEPSDKPWVLKTGEVKDFDITLSFNRKIKMISHSPFEPQRPFPYREREVTFVNPQAGVTLSGILTLPEGKGPFPAVVLVSGSGPNNRDEGYYDRHPFLVVADALARRGIAALRYDKRGVGKSSGEFKGAVTRDFEKDALAGIAYLRGLPEIIPQKVGMAGHSEGGLITSMAAAESKDVAFAVLMAGPGIKGDKRFALQVRYAAKGEGGDTKVVEAIANLSRGMIQIIRSDKDKNWTRQQLDDLFNRSYSGLSDAEKQKFDQILSTWGTEESVKEMVMTPWYRQLVDSDPQAYLQKVQCPILAMNGDKDMEEVYPDGMNGIAEALKEGGNRDYTLKLFPGMNHMFQICKTGTPLDYPEIRETVAPEVLDYMTDWIVKHTK
jgi:dienelactone hydrolase